MGSAASYQQIANDEESQQAAPIAKTEPNFTPRIWMVSVIAALTLGMSGILLRGFASPALSILSSPPPSDELTTFMYYHWKPLQCGGTSCIGKVTEKDTEEFKREITNEDLTRSRVSRLAESYVDQKFQDPEMKDGSDLPRETTEAHLLARLEEEYFSETSHKVVTSEEQTHSIETMVDYSTGYGFLQQCVYVEFKDANVPCVVLSSELRQRADPFLSTYVQNILNDPEANYDPTFWDLASNLIPITTEMRQMKNVNRYKTFQLPEVTFLTVEVVNIWEVVLVDLRVSAVGFTNKDNMLYADPLPRSTGNYQRPSKVFQAPIKEVSWDSNWVPLYEFTDDRGHHFYTQHAEEGLNRPGGNIICYIAQAPSGDPNLLPVYSYEDSKFHDHLYTMDKLSGYWSNERVIGYAYRPL